MRSAAKAVVKRILLPSARVRMRNFWEDVRDWVAVVRFSLEFVARRTAVPKVILYFGFALGDDLLCTAVLRELRKRGRDRLMMVSDHPELFAGNQDPTYVRPLWSRYYRDGSTTAICRRFARLWRGQFTRLEYAPAIGPDQRRQPSRHIIMEMCARAGIAGQVSIRPYLALSEEEKAAAGWARDKIVIQSSGMAARHPAKNKEWYPERFQGVVDALRDDVAFVQLGANVDPPLDGVTDLRGATTVRVSAAIIHHARLYVGPEGFLMHLARAVECPSVIVFGGRTAPWQLGYACNLNLYSAVPCAPCWRSNTCEYDRRCMSEIAVSDVVSAIRQMLARSRGPLAVETADIGPGIVPTPPGGSAQEIRGGASASA